MNFVERFTRRDAPAGIADRSLAGRAHPAHKWPIQYDSIELFAIIADLITITLISVLCGVVYDLLGSTTPDFLAKSLGSAILASALFISVMKSRGMYKPTELLVLRNQIRGVCLAWTGVFLLLAGAVFALKIGSYISRGSIMLFAASGLITLIVVRSLIRDLIASGLAGRRFSGRNIILITDHSQTGASLFHMLTSFGFHIQGYFIIPPPGADARGGEGLAAKVMEQVRGSDIGEIIIGADPSRWAELRTHVAELKGQPFPVSYIPIGAAAEIFKRPSRELGKAICVELQRGPLTAIEYAAKRSIDLLFAGTAIIVLLPLLALVAFAIKVDSPGPVIFRQRRCGFNGRSFQIYKFRTMSVLEDGPSIVQAQQADRRCTRIGAWLRRTSIDELPQLFNVLEGSMSLVGPRPHAMAHDNEFDKIVRKYAFRRRVKPGLTGWAQVNGYRGPTPTSISIERRVEYDLWYIDHWSLWLDFAILLWTPIEIFRGQNAY